MAGQHPAAARKSTSSDEGARPTDAVDELRAQWERERPDLGHLDAMALVGRINRASHHLTKGMKQVFARYGLDRAEFDVLATLRRSNPEHRLTPGALLKSAMVTSGAITNRLDRLEDKGLVERSPSPDDRRAVIVQLTGAGRELVDACVVEHVANEERMLAGLDAGQRAALDGALRRLLVSLGDTRLG